VIPFSYRFGSSRLPFQILKLFQEFIKFVSKLQDVFILSLKNAFKMSPFYKLYLLLFLFATSCQNPAPSENETSDRENTPFFWENATIYFLLTDRFNNGDKSNDVNFERTKETANLRGFMGGDIKGITQKIEEGYFNDLGVNAIWFTPVLEQIHGGVDEGTGFTYGFHGYWTKDWTALDPNFGTEEDLAKLVESAHKNGIRIIMDVIANHTGPVTEKDPLWADWARTDPRCTYKSMETTVTCTLVDNLPDIFTESDEDVELPKFILDKWEAEGRKEKELKELDDFFKSTGYPRSPRHYIIKWLVDLIKKYGVDGFRVDTAKHTESYVWEELLEEATKAFDIWKKANPDEVLGDNEFYMVGEVYNYNISGGRLFDYGDQKVDFYKDGFKSLVNFEFKYDVKNDYEFIFSKYSNYLNGDLKGKTVLNYISSHDDGTPFDQERKNPLEVGTKLLLCPGEVQIYYGDESARLLNADAEGDATLRSFMNWNEITQNTERNGYKIKDVLNHWQKLGTFRNAHPSVGAGVHEMLTQQPYTFKRTFNKNNYEDKVVVGLGLAAGEKSISVKDVFKDGEKIKDYYSNQTVVVSNGSVKLDSPFDIVLLGK
jgi:alpha-amylase